MWATDGEFCFLAGAGQKALWTAAVLSAQALDPCGCYRPVVGKELKLCLRKNKGVPYAVLKQKPGLYLIELEGPRTCRRKSS